MRRCISPEIRLALFLRYLATGAPPSILSDAFKLGITTIREIIEDVAKAVVATLPRPGFPDAASLVQRFSALRPNASPGVRGAIDGSHIRIATPCANASDYYCYKKFKSVILLAITGPDCECLWFHVGYPGKTGDARVFPETGVGAFVASLPPDNHLIGYGAFMLSKGLMKPFAFENASPAHEYFNFKLGSSRMVIECFFGQLKSRFRCLLDGLKFISMSTNCLVISSCIVLHNFILSNS